MIITQHFLLMRKSDCHSGLARRWPCAIKADKKFKSPNSCWAARRRKTFLSNTQSRWVAIKFLVYKLSSDSPSPGPKSRIFSILFSSLCHDKLPFFDLSFLSQKENLISNGWPSSSSSGEWKTGEWVKKWQLFGTVNRTFFFRPTLLPNSTHAAMHAVARMNEWWNYIGRNWLNDSLDDVINDEKSNETHKKVLHFSSCVEKWNFFNYSVTTRKKHRKHAVFCTFKYFSSCTLFSWNN